MIKKRVLVFTVIPTAFLVGLACQALDFSSPTPTASPFAAPTRTPLLLPPIPVSPGSQNPDEPVFITGEIRYTSPFFLNTIPQSMVLLEDQAGFVRRDRKFTFDRNSQVIGPVQVEEDQRLTFSLALPSVPNGTLVDVDNDAEQDLGVQVFALAYWSNTWGDPFLEERDAHGWSTAYASTLTDPESDGEIIGGILIVWSPDDNQSFPSEFGQDQLLFTEDDPVSPIPAGYNLVNLDQEPFRFYKESQPNLQLIEGAMALNDFSDLSYSEAFQKMFEKASQEYPFTKEKDIDWDALWDQFSTRVDRVRNDEDYYRVLRDFSLQIPDGHLNVSLNSQVFFEDGGGSFGLVLTELTDGRVIVVQVLPGTPGARAGIQAEAEITTWNGDPISEAISEVTLSFGPFSTAHARRIAQLNFLTRVPPDTRIELTFINPGASEQETISLRAEVEYDSLFQSFPGFNADEFHLPIEGEVLDESGLGYVRINSFIGDYQLIARLWDHYIQTLVDEEIPGLIIDLRVNGGGRSDLAHNFAGYFFDEAVPLYQGSYYSQKSGKFEVSGAPARIEPAPLYFEGPIAVLISPDCVSACEGFAYALAIGGRSVIVGHYPTAGAFGEVGRGQYKMPGDIDIQFPTGRPESLAGDLIIEGTGIIPDILVPVTLESAMGEVDAVLNAAVKALLERIR